MNAKDQFKLLKAGFTILRTSIASGFVMQFDGTIKQKTLQKPEWHLREKDFATKSAMERRVNELLKDEKTVLE